MNAGDHRRVVYLKPVHIPGLPERIEVPAGDMSIGRASSNGVVVPSDRFPQVSSHHARLSVGAEDVVIEDLGSRNGTYVNGNRTKRHVLRDGDFVQLGAQGPQFVFECLSGESPTVLVDGAALPAPRPDPSQTTLVRLKRALGFPEHADVAQLMQSHERRGRKVVWGAVVASVVVVAGVLYSVSLGRDDMDQLMAHLRAQQDETRRAFETDRKEWESQKKRREEERDRLMQRIQKLDENEQSSSTEVARLRQALDETNRRLEGYNPVNVEQARLAWIGRVQRAVVLIETKMRFRSSKTQRLLRRNEDDAKEEGVAAEASDDLYERESTGSGFCVGTGGHIISNAHVVLPSGHDQPIKLEDDETWQPEIVYAVVFSKSDQRHPARVVRALHSDGDDLALLKIEPFEGMPHLDGFVTDTPPPAAGAEVYLHGFPLGKTAVQEGDLVIASSFRGIMSRFVQGMLQVDAAVHQGNSGGPLTDASGRVIGVVCRVQRIPEGPLAPDMGYAIPVAALAKLWPPPPEAK